MYFDDHVYTHSLSGFRSLLVLLPTIKSPHYISATISRKKKRNSVICVRNTLVISERHCKKIKYKVSTLLLFGHECISLKYLKWKHWRIKNECSFPVASWKDPSWHCVPFISKWLPTTSLLKALKGSTRHPQCKKRTTSADLLSGDFSCPFPLGIISYLHTVNCHVRLGPC